MGAIVVNNINTIIGIYIKQFVLKSSHKHTASGFNKMSITIMLKAFNIKTGICTICWNANIRYDISEANQYIKNIDAALCIVNMVGTSNSAKMYEPKEHKIITAANRVFTCFIKLSCKNFYTKAYILINITFW